MDGSHLRISKCSIYICTRTDDTIIEMIPHNKAVSRQEAYIRTLMRFGVVINLITKISLAKGLHPRHLKTIVRNTGPYI